MLANPDFVDEMDYQPFHEYNMKTSTGWWQDFMSGDCAWWQAVSKLKAYHLYIHCLT